MESLIKSMILFLTVVGLVSAVVLAVAVMVGAGVGIVTLGAGGLALLCLQGINWLFRLGRRWY